jgi:hypothetical protein
MAFSPSSKRSEKRYGIVEESGVACRRSSTELDVNRIITTKME